MKRMLLIASLVMLLSLLLAGTALASTSQDSACWGQASAVYAQMGYMGEHSSEQPVPRYGLYNLAVLLYDDGDGPLSEPTIQALGAYVAAELGLSIDACM